MFKRIVLSLLWAVGAPDPVLLPTTGLMSNAGDVMMPSATTQVWQDWVYQWCGPAWISASETALRQLIGFS